jgi:Fe-S oxidoreductase
MDEPAAFEKWILALVLAGSLAAAWLRFRRVLGNILGSRPDPDFRWRPLGARLIRFATEVLLQSKVIRERPAAGLAHAVVFWGFCVFALATMNHLAAGFGVELISRQSSFGRAYFAVVAGFAAAVAVAITGLAVRRFWIRPRWLGQLSLESGVIALLIFLLMVTYLADYFAAGPGRLLWWVHTLALAVFLPLIPRTKHLHLALSPVTVFLEREGFSPIPPLAGDDDFGLDTGRDVTRLAALAAYTCVECGRCTEHCPAHNTGKELNPKQIILGLRGYLNEHGPRAAPPLLGAYLSQEAVFQCTTCGACEHQCPVGIQHLPLIVGLRRGAVNTGKWEDEHGTRLFLNLERYGNPLGLPPSERDKFLGQAGLPRFSGAEEFCLWLGCMGAYDPQGRQIVAALVRLLRFLGVSFGVLEREKCTGDAARRLGNDLLFEELAGFNLEQIERAGVRRLVSICPHCVRTISEDWRQVGAAPPIEHHSELLARYQSRLPAAAGARSVVFHDPCYLGRYRGIYGPPRDLARRSGPLVEPRRTRTRSFCCGAGGGLAFLGEEKGKRVSAERAEELAATGAEVIAAACPFCHTMFRDALAGVKEAPELLDIAQIAAAGLPQL